MDFPPAFPQQLIPRANIILDEAIKKFPKRDDIVALCRHALAAITPLLAKTVAPLDLLTQASEMLRYLMLTNGFDGSRIYEFQQSIRRSEEWLAISKIAAEALDAEKVEEQSDPTTWEQIEIVLLDEFNLQAFKAGNAQESKHYSVIGFMDGRTETPSMAWLTLRQLAENGGTIAAGGRTGDEFEKLRKRISEIRRLLRKYLAIVDSPIDYVENEGYKARFKIKTGPGY